MLLVLLMVGILVIRQVVVVSLGWCELGDEDLTPENSSKAVNRFFSDQAFSIPLIKCAIMVGECTQKFNKV